MVATSKDTKVLLEGFSNIIAKVLPARGLDKAFLPFFDRSAFSFWLNDNKFLTSAGDQSSKDRKSRFLFDFLELFGINSLGLYQRA
jgi:hypothetical protein